MALPPYSTSASAPTYSTSPGPDEHILQRAPLPGAHSRRPTGTSHEARRLDRMQPSNGYSRSDVVDEACSLYAKDSPHMQSCPAALLFSRRFPSKFKNNGRHYSLPPSCDVTFSDGSFLRCTYTVTFDVVARLHRSAPFIAREKSLSIGLEYRQRTRPSRPRIPEPSLFSTIKMCPEEWLQLPIALACGPDSTRAPDVHCDLFVPSVGVFGISEVVPFHLQLSGSTHSLRDLFLPPSNSVRGTPIPNSILRVYLLRQIVVDSIGQKKNTILGECPLRPLPPGIFGSRPSASDDALNWEGEIQLQDIDIPSFCIGTLRVMYLLAVELSPPETSSTKRAHYGYPIKVTTGTWADSAEQHL
ncbi:DUF3844 domain-containing protein [Mycena venus]|uniref:DUF3844 domain-containing protein n=1 Tax=Mycena venus TaxID=2733690 RepID=A0A8H6YF56_9AGAR|nr:DUF3844 domain-containing protein [Mycena venus]